ncbi:MAG: MarR family winged helix-turn-helix transcriptional regulator [Saprospiraceae bacterium]
MTTTEELKIFGTLIARTSRVIRLSFTQAFREHDLDITPEQWVILDKLYQDNGLSQTELASDSFKNAPTVSRIIDLLCDKKLTERQRFKNDRRRYKIFLTPTGKTLVEKALPIVADLRTQGWQGLSEADYTGFQRIMNQIFKNFAEK